MGTVISFEDQAVARLRERLGAAEEAKADLLAFARGHSGAVAAIHEAVIAAMEADKLEHLLAVATQDWPSILSVDSVALALVVGSQGFRADEHGLHLVERRLIDRSSQTVDGVVMCNVQRGHPLFGTSSGRLRSQALIRVDSAAPMPHGLLLLGQREEQSIDGRHGCDLLLFLGRSLAAMMRRCLTPLPTI